MDSIINSENIIVIASLIVYAIVFIIQKAQFNKQNEILNKYEKIFSIFNVDEIEKYVELQKKSINLSLNNREIELSHKEIDITAKMTEIETILDSHNSILQLTDSMKDDLKSYGVYFKHYIVELDNITKIEFETIYQIIEQNISISKFPDLHLKILKELSENKKRHETLKNEILLKTVQNIQNLIKK